MDDDHSRALLRWLSFIDLPEAIVLGCDHTDLPRIARSAIGVRYSGCLADASVSLPAQLLAVGVAEILLVECTARREEFVRTLASWTRTLDGVRRYTEPAPRRFAGRPGPVLTMGSRLVSRRVAMGMRPTTEMPFDLDLDASGRGLAALRILQGQGRAHVDRAADPVARPSAAIPLAAVLRAQGCTACGVCVRACPHDALQLDDHAGVSVLRHQVDACRGEQACVALCPVSALSVVGGLDLLELTECRSVELARTPTVRCPRCGARHPQAEDELCELCRFRAGNAFGSRWPPSVDRN